MDITKNHPNLIFVLPQSSYPGGNRVTGGFSYIRYILFFRLSYE